MNPLSVRVPEYGSYTAVPEAVPPALRDACDVVFLVGEFAARYGDAYAVPREGVVLVPGMELYIENWLGLSLGVPTE